MVDSKITALTALTAVNPADLLAIVDDVPGTPVTKKITVADLVPAGINGHLIRVLSADTTGSNVNTAQPWFPTNGAVTLAGSTSYFFDGMFHSVRTAGGTSHTTGLSFGGTATLTSIDYMAFCKELDVATISDADLVVSHVATTTNVKAASTSANENILITIQGIVRVNAGGTLIPQFIYSAAPGQAPTIKLGTYFKLFPIGDNTVTTIGTWS